MSGSSALVRALLDNPNFVKWFGKSKIVDERGLPVRMYHGTSGEHNVLDPSRVGSISSHWTQNPTDAVWLTSSPRYAGEYAQNASSKTGGAERVIDGFVKSENPLIVDFDGHGKPIIHGVRAGGLFDSNESVLEYAKNSKKGYDSVWWKNGSFTDEPSITIFDGKRFKSSENRGTFDPDDPNFLRSSAPAGGGLLAALGLSSQGGTAPYSGPLSWLLSNFSVPRAVADAAKETMRAVDQQGNIVSGKWRWAGQDDAGNTFYRDAQGQEHKMPAGHALKAASDMAGWF